MMGVVGRLWSVHLLTLDGICCCGIKSLPGELDWDGPPLNRGKGAVPESASRRGPAPILGAAIVTGGNPKALGWERTEKNLIHCGSPCLHFMAGIPP